MTRSQELVEIYNRFMTHLTQAKQKMRNLFEESKLRCDKEDRLPYFDTFSNEADAVFASKKDFVDSLFKRNEDEIALLREAFEVVKMNGDQRAEAFVETRHLRHVVALEKSENEFVEHLNNYFLGMEPIIKRLAI